MRKWSYEMNVHMWTECSHVDGMFTCGRNVHMWTECSHVHIRKVEKGCVLIPRALAVSRQLCFSNRRANLGGLANSWTRTAL